MYSGIIKEERTATRYGNNMEKYVGTHITKDNVELGNKYDRNKKCKRCGHIKTGIAHKVFTSCAKYKHKTYNPIVLLNNYLLKMSRVVENEDDYERYLDDISYIPRLNNAYIDNIYKEVKINVEH